MKRSQIAILLAIILVVLTFGVAVAGMLVYNQLNTIVANLQTDDRPNKNIIRYKEILVYLQAMDNEVESFQLTGNTNFLQQYDDSYSNINQLLDSIQIVNVDDPELLMLNDSLHALVQKKSKVLNQLITVNNVSTLDELESLSDFFDEHQTDPIVVDSTANQTETPKVNFFKRLFTRSSAETQTNTQSRINEDSLAQLEQDKLRAELNEQIERIKTNSKNKAQAIRNEQMELETKRFDLQNQILDLIGYLENRENVKLRIITLKARELVASTNERIGIFSILVTLLLLTSLIVTFIYIQRNRAYQQLLQQSKLEVEQLAKAKERFFANMSHEIRTPMNAISGFSKILKEAQLPDKLSEHVDIIDQSSDHLLNLLNDILDFSKLQAERLELEQKSFSIQEICETVFRLLSQQAHDKQLDFKLDIQNVPAQVIGDANRLRQILINILHNAIKFTPTGKVSLQVSGNTEQEICDVQFVITDTGIGIPQKDQNRLFQEFAQANPSSFSKGTGLGLAITKKLVLLHQGSMNLESTEGMGTTIQINIPFYKASDVPITEGTLKEENLTFQQHHVLVVDDEPFNVKLLTALLTVRNNTFEIARDGREALELLREKKFDVVLLDLKLPKVTGWEVARILRNNEGINQKTFMVALTATSSFSESEKSANAYFDLIVLKPFDADLLFNQLAEKIEISVQTEKPASVNQPNHRINLEALHRMGDTQFVLEMTQTFHTSLSDGMNELEYASRSADFQNISLIAHRMVSPVRHFGDKVLVDLLKTLEQAAGNEESDQVMNLIEQLKPEVSQVLIELEQTIETL